MAKRVLSKILSIFFEKGLVEILTDPRTLFIKTFRTRAYQYGTFVGEDVYGNKYYENLGSIKHRSRFVEFPFRGVQEFDASLVPPEWFNWLHHTTDRVPKPDDPKPFYSLPHIPNQTLFRSKYMGCRTTKPKFEAWKPQSCRSQEVKQLDSN
ncbi:putative NADH dehydrogenase [ubiquinone] 1 alpha subcomplex subunit 12 [Thelohanellus kitauei]|uniref:NADH dehydrogenase [ubiquinone] 1 alpha subcomplex subunit 12 n=1 Tax=Thelohanellus kitauei TaxID=669202 RepID=A0A0C2MRB7_THEKT|nr:putative NADH dehydrogenase [ubiquinone] 1 alpha subcomplex subunit 12 [Thelohanellus kitauei]